VKLVRVLVVIAVLLAAPAVALAGHIEPSGALHTNELTGTDKYGKVSFDLNLNKKGKVVSIVDFVYANTCSKSAEIPGGIEVSANGAFAAVPDNYAVSGIVTLGTKTVGGVTDDTATAWGSVETTTSCHGATRAPIDFKAKY
jgi:hypothetical protein